MVSLTVCMCKDRVLLRGGEFFKLVDIITMNSSFGSPNFAIRTARSITHKLVSTNCSFNPLLIVNSFC